MLIYEINDFFDRDIGPKCPTLIMPLCLELVRVYFNGNVLRFGISNALSYGKPGYVLDKFKTNLKHL
jgi:hypothetical protein